MMRFSTLIAIVMPLLAGTAWASASPVVVDFEDLPLEAESYYNGSDFAGGFTSRGVSFENLYTVDSFEWDGVVYETISWEGFAYANVTDNTTAGYGNQYSAITGSGRGGSGNYAVAFPSTQAVNLPVATVVEGFWATNATYPALSMLYGDGFAKKFGDDPATEDVVETDYPSWFDLTVTGHTGVSGDGEVAGSVTFRLADYTGTAEQDYVLQDWAWVDLSGLGAVRSLTFALTSSDTGNYGMNTPNYFVMDDLTLQAVPEPMSLSLLAIGGAAVLRRRRG